MMRKRLLLICMSLLVLMADIGAAYANCPTGGMQQPARNMSRFEIGQCATSYTGLYYQQYEFTTKLVACIEGTIVYATYYMMDVIAQQFWWLTASLSTLVIMFMGVRIMMGERELLKRTMTLTIKLAFVVGFMAMLPQLVQAVFAIFNELLALVSGGISPWVRIDSFLGNLLGFGPSISMFNGLVGLIGASAFSSKVGITMFFFGIIAVLNLLVFIMQLIYTYCLAVMTIGFLLVLSPIMIPLALFFYTERYFKKWYDIIVSAMLTPILIFAFLWMFIGIFDVLIHNIFDIMGGNNFKAYWRLNTSLFSWVMPSDPNQNMMMQNLSRAGDLDCVSRNITSPIQGNINPFAKNAFDAGVGRMATLNFGANDVNIVQRLSFAFITLWIFASIMKSMIVMIPQIASSMATVSSHIAFGGGSAVIGKLQGQVAKMEAKVKAVAGSDSSTAGITSQISEMIGKRK